MNVNNASYVAIPLSDKFEIWRVLRRVNRRALAHTTNTASDLENVVADAESELIESGTSPVGAVLVYTSGGYESRTYTIRTQTCLVRAVHGWVVVRATRVKERDGGMMLLLHPDLLDAIAKSKKCYCAYGLPAALVPVVATLAPECHASLLQSACPDVRLAAIKAMA